MFQADAISTLEKENDYREEHFDFIQMHVRNFCLHCILPHQFNIDQQCSEIQQLLSLSEPGSMLKVSKDFFNELTWFENLRDSLQSDCVTHIERNENFLVVYVLYRYSKSFKTCNLSAIIVATLFLDQQINVVNKFPTDGRIIKAPLERF